MAPWNLTVSALVAVCQCRLVPEATASYLYSTTLARALLPHGIQQRYVRDCSGRLALHAVLSTVKKEHTRTHGIKTNRMLNGMLALIPTSCFWYDTNKRVWE